MNWIEEAKSIFEEINQFESERPHRLFIESSDDLKADYTGFTSVFISTNYEGPSPISVLQDVIESDPDLRAIGIYGVQLSWEEICSLNIANIEKLGFSLKGEIGSSPLISKSLKKLTISAEGILTPLEMLINPVPFIDFTGIPEVEHLELRNIQQVNPDDFRHLKKLAHLIVTGSNIIDLNWLKDADYRLSSLYIDYIENCDGLGYQPCLQKLLLLNSDITDVGPIEKLRNLKVLDLRFSTIPKEGNLRSMGIEKVLITRRDGSIDSLDSSVKRLLRYAVMRILHENKRIIGKDEMPEYRRELFLKRICLPFEERVKQHVRFSFDAEIKELSVEGYKTFTSLSQSEYLEIYRQKAFEYYPFLLEKAMSMESKFLGYKTRNQLLSRRISNCNSDSCKQLTFEGDFALMYSCKKSDSSAQN